MWKQIKQLKNTTRFGRVKLSDQFYFYDSLNGVIFTNKLTDQIDSLSNRFSLAKCLFKMEPEQITNLAAVLDKIKAEPQIQFADIPLTEIGIAPSNKCNLACDYCFQEEHHTPDLSVEKIIQSIDQIIFEYSKDSSEFDLSLYYTSEPLISFHEMQQLRQHFNTDKYAEKEIRFWFCTNGTIMNDKIIEFLQNEMHGNIRISIDGPDFVHDQHRKFPNGQGTHKIVLQNIKRLQDAGLDFNVDVTLTPFYPRPKEITEYLISIGANEVLMKPVRCNSSIAFSDDNIDELLEGYKDFFEFTWDMFKNDPDTFRIIKGDYALRKIKRILFNYKVERRCFWGNGKVFLDAQGGYYTCNDLMGKPEFKIGSIEEGIDFSQIKDDYKLENRIGKCKECWAKYICGGTCYANSYYCFQDIRQICEWECKLEYYLAEKCLEFICKAMADGSVGELQSLFKPENKNLYKLPESA